MKDPITIMATTSLLFTKIYIILPVFLVGYFFKDRRVFANAASLVFFMMILNTFLKYIWKISLPTDVGTGYAFPSGHMSIACVFWGYLTIRYSRPITITLLAILLTAIGTSLMYFGYHTLLDILGSVFFSGIVLAAFYYVSKDMHDRIVYTLYGTLCVISGILLSFMPYIFTYNWVALGGLGALTFINVIFKRY